MGETVVIERKSFKDKIKDFLKSILFGFRYIFRKVKEFFVRAKEVTKSRSLSKMRRALDNMGLAYNHSGNRFSLPRFDVNLDFWKIFRNSGFKLKLKKIR